MRKSHPVNGGAMHQLMILFFSFRASSIASRTKRLMQPLCEAELTLHLGWRGHKPCSSKIHVTTCSGRGNSTWLSRDGRTKKNGRHGNTRTDAASSLPSLLKSHPPHRPTCTVCKSWLKEGYPGFISSIYSCWATSEPGLKRKSSKCPLRNNEDNVTKRQT